MTMNTLQPLWTACRSSLQLDRLLRGELPGSEAAALRAHLADCARCNAGLSELRAAQLEDLPPLRALDAKPVLLKLVRDEPARAEPRSVAMAPAAVPAPIPPRETPKRSAWAKSFSLVTGLAAAAAAILVLRPAAGERSKGSPQFSLGMYVQHGDSVRLAGPGDRVHPGDAVRFAIRAPRAEPEPGYVAVLSRDPRGHASIYFPAGSRAAALGADETRAADIPLPLGTRLDDTVGQEQLLGLFCARAVDLEPIRASLEQGKPAIPEGCQTSQWSFEKR